MSQIKCTNCHQNIDSSDKFCPHCGAIVQQNSQEEHILCAACGYSNTSDSTFCEKCGASLKENPASAKSKKTSPKKLESTGTYSGSMVKSKSSKSYKIFKIILLVFLVIGVIAFIIWFNNDSKAKEKLFNVLFSAGFILIFVLIIWRKSKKGKIKSAKQRAVNYDWDDLDKDNDDYDDD